jgi:hypothetical protein
MGFLDYLRGFKKSNRYRTISKQKLPEWDMYGKKVDNRPDFFKLNPSGISTKTMGKQETQNWNKKFDDFKKRIIG